MPRRQPPVEYAAMGRRLEARGQISRTERQRLEFLEDRVLVIGLDPDEAAELAYLRGLAGTGPPAPPVVVKDGGCCDRSAPGRVSARRSGRRALLDTLAAKNPHRRLTGRQAICMLEEMRGDWYLTPRQLQVQRMRRPA
jgi:hypothetical protein